MSNQLPENPVFSWSFSRKSLLEDCLAKYYFKYYLSWMGWNKDAPPERRKAYTLKNLTSLPILTGNVIHNLADSAIAGAVQGVTPSPHQMHDNALVQMRQAWAQSKNRKQEFLQKPKSTIMMQEFYYASSGPGNKAIAKMKEKIKAAAKNLARTKTFFEVLRHKRYKTLDKSTSFTWRGITIYAIPDIYYETEKYLVISDWKTGEQDEKHKEQLLTYALFIKQYLNLKKPILGRLEYLLTGDNVEIEISDNDIKNVAEPMILKSVKEMKKVLLNPAENIAHPTDRYLVARSGNCRWCQYQELCEGFGQ